jgi:DNA polymerase III subunit epsilon
METYKTWDDVPDTLATCTQLGKMGLKPAKDQKPAAIKAGWKRYGPYDLFEIALAVPKRKLSEAQTVALEAARVKAMTTTCCNRYVGVINWREKGNMCWRCYQEWQDSQHEAMTKEAETEASEWASSVLADPLAVILDTETTGLEGEIVEISIIRPAGLILLNTLIKPKEPIPANATAIHGIDNEMVKDAPGFSEVYPEIKRIVEAASRVIIYNASFDTGILAWDCSRCELPRLKFKSDCAMEWYAAWYGDWNDYYKSFRWQKLAGGHRALGDCLATLELIKRMAK